MILDTSIVLDFIWEREPVSTELTKLLIESGENAYITQHQLAEISDVTVKNNRDPNISFTEVELFVTKISLTKDDLIESGKIKWQCRQEGRTKFSLADAVMLAVSIRTGQTLITKDRDFIGIDGVKVLGIKP